MIYPISVKTVRGLSKMADYGRKQSWIRRVHIGCVGVWGMIVGDKGEIL
jgi:hypothetical protein